MRTWTGLGILVVALAGGCGDPEDIGANDKNVLAPHCYDKKVSGGETDIDCGGADCNKCDNGKVCAANADCASGACRNGVCVDPNACNAPCNYANGVGQCKAGRCELVSCNAGFGDCDQDAANGCEIDLGGDAANCGACGNVCDSRACNAGKCDPVLPCGGLACSFANGVGQCINDKCTLVSCNAGFGDCNQNQADGCEVDLASSAANCGACGNACRGVACNKGVCGGGAFNCNQAGFLDCDRNVANGCEVNSMVDPSNCGACGVLCLKNQKCLAGACL